MVEVGQDALDRLTAPEVPDARASPALRAMVACVMVVVVVVDGVVVDIDDDGGCQDDCIIKRAVGVVAALLTGILCSTHTKLI